MLVNLDRDQELFRETTAKLLDELVPVAELRRRRDDPDGFDDEYWRRGAELGWTSLLVGEEHGGGSIGGKGLVDLALVAYEFGRHAAPGPLVVTNVVAATLDEAGDSGHGSVISELLSGGTIATWCFGEPGPNMAFDGVAMRIDVVGDQLVLNGAKRPVESGARADQLLVTGRTGTGVTQVLVPAGTAGVSVTPMHTIDLTRRFSVVTFDDVRIPSSAVVGEVGKAGEQVRRQLRARRGHCERRGGRDDAVRLRHDRGVGLRSLFLRAPTGVLPGAQAPIFRHEDLAGGEPCHQRRSY